jgi:serine/tyrosine/threonine adenylyltransferase
MHLYGLKSGYRPDVKITSLGDKIGDPVDAAHFPQTILRFRNDLAAAEVGLDGLNDTQWIEHFGRFKPLIENMQQPLALRYHGHQFRNYNPDIGDGRGFLFAQMRDAQDRLMDLGTKGSGQTPYSRFGDGRLTLKGAVREILAAEMLQALGVPTSRTLSVIETGEALERNDEPSPTRAAVLVRLNHSHIRIGTFQRIAFEADKAMMEQIVNYCLIELYGAEPGKEPSIQLLNLAVERAADLAASYMVAGFVHGVLNTDNINITGESFDYGPWRFAPHWDTKFIAAYFDHSGLYSFGRQAEAIHWNLGQLAISLRLLVESAPLVAALERFPDLFQSAFVKRFMWRLGLKSKSEHADRELVYAAEKALAASRIEPGEFFRRYRGAHVESPPASELERDFISLCKGFEPGSADNEFPSCSLLIDEVEAIWDAIDKNDDWQPLQSKVSEMRHLGNLLAALPMNDK